VEPLEALGGLVIQPAWRPLEAPFLKTLESNTAGKSSMILYAKCERHIEKWPSFI
jgi:hypothetical protein